MEVEGLKPWGDKRETHVGEMQGLVGTMHTCKQEMQTDIHEMKGLQHSMESRVKELKTLTERAKTDPESLRKQFGSYERGLKEMQKQSAAFDKALKTQMDGIEDRARKRNERVNSEFQSMHKTVAEVFEINLK